MRRRDPISIAATLAIVGAGPAAAQPVELTPPEVVASIADDPRDGEPDDINIAPDDAFADLIREQSTRESRAIHEYDISQFSGMTIVSATISGRVVVNNAFDNGERTFDFGIYEGDGEAMLSDFNADDTVVGSGSYAPPDDSEFSFEFDVTDEVQAIVDNGGNWAGLLVDPTSSPNFPNQLDDASGTAVLTIEAEPADDCPPDIDGDGEVTSTDFLEFIDAFAAGDPVADFDGNGSIGSDDFLAFIDAFAAGCP